MVIEMVMKLMSIVVVKYAHNVPMEKPAKPTQIVSVKCANLKPVKVYFPSYEISCYSLSAL